MITVVNILQDVCNSIVLVVDNETLSVNYQPGRNSQIIQSLTNYDHSDLYKSLKYPLLAAVLPFKEKRGGSVFSEVTIDRIVLATLTETNTASEDVLQKYSDTGRFSKILIPFYNEFLKRLALHPNVINSDPGNFPHEYFENPAEIPISRETNDFVDSIEIRNLKFIIQQNQIC